MALAWRIRREISMEAEGETTWITLADIFIAISFLVLIGGVFLAPMQGVPTTGAIKLLGLALVIFAPSVFVLAGHYNLYCNCGVRFRTDGTRESRDRFTKQEKFIATIGGAMVFGYVILTWIPWQR